MSPPSPFTPSWSSGQSTSWDPGGEGQQVEQTSCLLPLPSLPHGAQVSQENGILDEGANRWSKPHVSSLSLHSLMELRSVKRMDPGGGGQHVEQTPCILPLPLTPLWSSGQSREWDPGGGGQHVEQTTCLLPLPSLPHGAQVSHHHEGANRWSKPHVSSLSLHFLMELRSVIIMRGPTGGANPMSLPSPFTSSWSSGQSTSWDLGGGGQQVEQTTCLLPLPSLPHGAQVSQHHGILNEGTNRWSKPLVSSLSLHFLMELRSVNIMGSCKRGTTGGANLMSPPSQYSLMELRSVNIMGSL